MNRTRSAVLLSVAALAFAAGQALPTAGRATAAQPDKKDKAPPGKKDMQPPKKDGMPDMQAMMAKMQLGPEHKRLEIMLGDWQGDVKFWMAPGTDPMTSHGTLHREMIMDGRFLVEHVEGTSADMPGPFKGLGTLGYNTLEKNYEFTWIENQATWISFAKGSWNEGKKTLTFEGDDLNPMTGKRARQRSVIDLSDPNKRS